MRTRTKAVISQDCYFSQGREREESRPFYLTFTEVEEEKKNGLLIPEKILFLAHLESHFLREWSQASSRQIVQSRFISSKWTMPLSILIGFRPRALLSSQD